MADTTQGNVQPDDLKATTSTMANDSLSAFGMEEFAAPGAINLFLFLPLIILLMLVTIVGNIIVMICVRKDKRLASSISSIYVFSLAGADTLVGVFIMGGMTFHTMYGYWPLGPLPCTVWVLVDFCTVTVSMLHLCLIAYDRHGAVIHPIDYRQNRTTFSASMHAIGAWIVGFGVWLPAIVVFRVLDPGPVDACWFVPDHLYVLIQTLIVYFGPIAIMLIFYVKCLNVLRQRYIKTAATEDGPKLFMPKTTTTTAEADSKGDGQTESQDEGRQANGNDPDALVSQAKRTKQRRQLRSIRMLGVVMGVFLFCWLPFCFMWPIIAYCPTCVSLQAFQYSYWSAYLNSAVNPYLYFMSNRDFRSAFMTIIGRGC